MEYLGMCIFFSTVWACEAFLYSKGHSTFLFKHKTPEEKAIQRKQTGEVSNEPT